MVQRNTTNLKVKQSVSKLKGIADAYWSQYIRYRDGDYRNGQWFTECITCGKWLPYSKMQCGHFISRSSTILRYSEMNTNAQCYQCNVVRHGQQYVYAMKIDQKYGEGTAAELHKESKQEHKFTIGELQQVIDDAKEYIKFYKEHPLGLNV
jgi:hypothetical protein